MPFRASISGLTSFFHIVVSSSVSSSCPHPMAVAAVIPNRLSLVFHCGTRTDDDPGNNKICSLIHRMRNETDSIPDIFLDVLTPASRIHNHNTRFVSNVNYFRPRVSTISGKTSFKFSAPKICTARSQVSAIS